MHEEAPPAAPSLLHARTPPFCSLSCYIFNKNTVMAAPGSHPCYEDLPPGAVSEGRRAGLRGPQFPHHSRDGYHPPPCPLPQKPAVGAGHCAGFLLIADLGLGIPWAEGRGWDGFSLRRWEIWRGHGCRTDVSVHTQVSHILFKGFVAAPPPTGTQNPGHGSQFKT